MPRVSIGLPAFNAERYIALAIESLLAQTYSDMELIVCDNASTDGTGAIASTFARRDPRVRYVRNAENIGAGRNFTKCALLARGELFRWASADDLSAPTYVERCVAVLEEHPDVVQVLSHSVFVDENGAELEKYDERIATLADSPRERYLHVMRNLGHVNGLYGVMRINMLRRTLLHRSYQGADEILQAEIALYGKIQLIPEYLFMRRMHSGAHSAMTAAQRDAHYDPTRAPVIRLVGWRHLCERIRTILRSPLQLREKTLLLASVLRNALGRRDQFMRELRAAGTAVLRRVAK